jgi:hypothetical protein
VTRPDQDPIASDPRLAAQSRGTGRWPRWVVFSIVGCGSLIGQVGFLGLVGIGLVFAMEYLPYSNALSEKEIPESTLAWLRERELIQSDERVLCFYAAGFFGFRDGGCFVTNRRVVKFSPGELDGPESFTSDLRDVIEVSARLDDDWGYHRPEIYVETADQREAALPMPDSSASSRTFVEVLEQACRSQRALAIEGLNADGSMKLEAQVQILRRFGIVMPRGLSIEDLCTAHPREEYEKAAFEFLFTFLDTVERDAVPGRDHPGDVLVLAFRAIKETGDYTRIVRRLRDLADGALPLEQISDELDRRRRIATIRFTIDGKAEQWEADFEHEWIDHKLFHRFDELLSSRSNDKRLVRAFRKDDLAVMIACIEPAELVELRRQTGMDFEFFE